MPFFDSVRAAFGPLKQPQVDGFNVLLAATAGLPIAWRAYILATAWHETARTMQPIAEYGKGKGKAYGKKDQTGKAPYGRGYVQLTWRFNYEKADKILGLNGRLAADYDLAMDPAIAAKIIVRGMTEGWFTTRKLGHYAHGDFKNYRLIVNGADKADLIADYARKFEAALAGMAAADPEKPVQAGPHIPAPMAPKPAPTPATPSPAAVAHGSWWAWLFGWK